MHFASLALLSGLAAAIDPPAGQGNPYVAQFNGFVAENFGSYLPSLGRYDEEHAAETLAGDKKMHVLTLDNWREKLYAPVKEDATEPELWWILITGGNKTCFGQCGKVEAAWNETAVKFAQLPNSPHMGYINCDDQQIMCNSWSAGTSIVWRIEMLPPPATIDIYLKRVNTTTTTSESLVELWESGTEKMKLHEGAFHPFHGWLVQNGLVTPVAYVLWLFSNVPSWAFMVLMSFVSRSLMNRNMNRLGPNPPAHGGAAPAPAAAR